jgi:hypothetical protein
MIRVCMKWLGIPTQVAIALIWYIHRLRMDGNIEFRMYVVREVRVRTPASRHMEQIAKERTQRHEKNWKIRYLYKKGPLS